MVAVSPADLWADTPGHRRAAVAEADKPRPVTATDLFTPRTPPFLREVHLGGLDIQQYVEEDAVAPFGRVRTGLAREVNVTARHGQWEKLQGIGWLWTVAIVSDGATAIRLHFANVSLPEGAQLAVRDGSGTRLFGPYQAADRNQAGEFWTPDIIGEKALVEYFWPDSRRLPLSLPFVIDEVMHNYHEIFTPPQERAGAREGPCHNDVLCFPEWAIQRDATAMITFVSGPYQYFCSATLLSTTSQDETPYMLTANHCISTESEADSMTAYWFFQTAYCDGPAPSLGNSPTSDEADVLATNGTYDQTLLMVDGALPDDITFAGWSQYTIGTGRDVSCISHPDAAYKRITFGYTIDHPWGDTTNYIGITWTSGTIEDGSSGSAMFRDSDQLLYAVASHSALPHDCSNPDGPSGYGRFSRFYPSISDHLAGGLDDDFEDNDECPSAGALGEGIYEDCIVKSTDEDWYRITIPACHRLLAYTQFTAANGDIDLQLFDGCGGTELDSAHGTGGFQSVQHQNYGPQMDAYLRVYLVHDTRQEYILTVSFTQLGDPVNITDQPDSQTVDVGDPVTFEVVAEGTEPLSYQWKKDGDLIPGAEESTYEIASAQLSDAGDYTCEVSNLCGAVESEVATLTVQGGGCCPCVGDLSDPCDDFVNATDFTIFANAYGSQIGYPNYNPCADLAPEGAPDGFVNATDFTVFANHYLQPCP